MKILDFRYITKNDKFDDTYPHWSRKYEYPTVLDILNNLDLPVNLKIHNSSWGFDIEHHQRFKSRLEKEYGVFSVTNSDIIYSGFTNTCVHDITKEPNDNFKESFDLVLNVSALEEIPGDHVLYLSNLLEQVKPGGYLIITFDLPGLQIENIQQFLNTEISKENYEDRIIGSGAPCIEGLNVGLLIICK
jgi:SAM-dependent methyltransferase